MDFELTATQRKYRGLARDFAVARLAPGYAEREARGQVEPEIRAELGGLGLLRPEVPAALGGRDLDRLTSGMILEETARGDFNVGYLQVVGSLVGQILVTSAPQLAAEWVPRICAGEQIVGIGLTEPHAGSDAGMPRLRAQPDQGDYILTGVKSLSFANDAAAVVVFARTSDTAQRGRRISAFLVPLDAPGVTRELYRDMGTKAVGRGAAHFDGARIPASHLIGAEGQGFTQVMHGFDFSRALIGLQCLGAAQVTVEETWDYVTKRESFGQPLSRNQGVAFPLAEADTMIAAARLLCYQALSRKDAGLPHTAEAAMGKWLAPKVAFDAFQPCLLLPGQYGYRTELPIEQRLRDVLGLQIGDGTAQIMKMIIARQRVGRQYAP